MIHEVRREKEIEEMKQKILDAAHQIIVEEGFDQVSIRKIAKLIEYSPSIVYHYFKDKDEILNVAMHQRYQTIIQAVSSTPTAQNPIETLQAMTRNYIGAAVTMGDEFLIAQLRPTSVARKHTASLFANASTVKPALGMLCNCLKKIHPDHTNEELELTAQMITTSTLGLVLKLIVENDIDERQKTKLIDRYCDDVVLRIAGCK